MIPHTLAAAAFLAVLLTLNAPGITIDEPLDVRPGRTYVETLFKEGVRFFSPQIVERVFRDNAEHPPLGRWLLGIASKLGETVEILLAGGADPIGLYVRSGRLAPAACFALLVFLVSREAGKRHGNAAAWSAGLSLIAMPRVFSHAHLGALDTFITVFWTAALLSVDRAFDSETPRRAFAQAGLVWSLALLTKIHAWLLPPLVLARWLTSGRVRRTTIGLFLWGIVGLCVFFVGWPWLWYDPIGRLTRYLGTGVERTAIHVLYFGHIFDDRSVPWHYPWFYFLTTVPLGVHLAGFWGAARAWIGRRMDARDLRILVAILFLLGLFSTNVPVYDGERLYLMVFPLWALVIGRGFSDLWARCASLRNGRRVLAGALACQFVGLISVFPYGLSYYNLAVGGLQGAERLGLELCYWSEAVDGRLLGELASRAQPRATAALAPTLAPSQGVIATTRPLIAKSIVLADQEAIDRSDWIVVYRREAYFSPQLRALLSQGEAIYHQTRQGVWLSALFKPPKK